jgi:6-phosphogluconolactonase
MNERVYVQTNDAERNEVIAFDRSADGRLSLLGTYETGGRGTGKPHLASQSSIVLSDDGAWLLVTNAGSDELSLFAVEADGLRLAARTASGGTAPTSVAVRGELVYALNNGTPSIAGFTLAEGDLAPLEGSSRELSRDADPAQIAFNPDGSMLVLTERGTNSITTFAVDERGHTGEAVTIPSAGATPYGFDFANGAIVVTEAFGGEIGKASASAYSLAAAGRLEPVSASVANTRSEVCWAVATPDGRFVYVTNFGDGTISSYAVRGGTLELMEAVAGSTGLDKPGIRDEALSRDGRFLYAIDADAQRVFGWSVGDDGNLEPVDAVGGVPATVAGLAAS